MLLGYVLLSGMPVLVRLLGRTGWGAASTTAVRFGLGIVFVALTVLFTPHRIATKQPLLLFLRGALGGFSVLTYFLSVQLTGAGMGTLLNYTHSVWSNVLAVIILNKRPSPQFWGLLAMALLGLYLVINPSFTHFDRGKLYGLFSGILGGAAILCIKQLRRTDTALTIMASFSTVGFACACCLLPFENLAQLSLRGTVALPCLLAIAILSFSGQLLFTHGYQQTSFALGGLLSLLVPVLATLLGWAFLQETLTVRYALGSFLVLSAGLWFGWSERRDHIELSSAD